MAGSALFEVQKAVYSTLKNDATLTALVNGVFDSPPENQDFPYVILGESTEVRWNTLAASGKQLDIEVAVWSQYQGAKEAVDVMARIAVLLDGVSLTLTGYEHVGTTQTRAEVTREGDGLTRRGSMQFSVWTKQV